MYQENKVETVPGVELPKSDNTLTVDDLNDIDLTNHWKQPDQDEVNIATSANGHTNWIHQDDNSSVAEVTDFKFTNFKEGQAYKYNQYQRLGYQITFNTDASNLKVGNRIHLFRLTTTSDTGYLPSIRPDHEVTDVQWNGKSLGKIVSSFHTQYDGDQNGVEPFYDYADYDLLPSINFDGVGNQHIKLDVGWNNTLNAGSTYTWRGDVASKDNVDVIVSNNNFSRKMSIVYQLSKVYLNSPMKKRVWKTGVSTGEASFTSAMHDTGIDKIFINPSGYLPQLSNDQDLRDFIKSGFYKANLNQNVRLKQAYVLKSDNGNKFVFSYPEGTTGELSIGSRTYPIVLPDGTVTDQYQGFDLWTNSEVIGHWKVFQSNLSLEQLKSLHYEGLAISAQDSGAINFYEDLPFSKFKLKDTKWDRKYIARQLLTKSEELNLSEYGNNPEAMRQIAVNTVNYLYDGPLHGMPWTLTQTGSFQYQLADLSEPTGVSWTTYSSDNFEQPVKVNTAFYQPDEASLAGQAGVTIHYLDSSNGGQIGNIQQSVGDPDVIADINSIIPKGYRLHNYQSKDVYANTYHLNVPENGFMNDVQGAFYRDGLWHLYFLFNKDAKYDSNGNQTGGNGTEWYHVTTNDFINYNYEGIAIKKYQTEWGDVASGSLYVDKDNDFGKGKNAIIVFATAYGGAKGQNMMAYYSTDGGYHFNLLSTVPILKHVGKSNTDFRDPYFMKIGNKYVIYMAEGDKIGQYVSDHPLSDYHYVGGYYAPHATLECPSLLPMNVNGNNQDQKWVLFYAGNDKELSTGTYASVGHLDNNLAFVAEQDDIRVDNGPDFYGAKFFLDKNETHDYVLGSAWEGNWTYATKHPHSGETGTMSSMRKVKLVRDNDRYMLVSSLITPDNVKLVIHGHDISSGQVISDLGFGDSFQFNLHLKNMKKYHKDLLFKIKGTAYDCDFLFNYQDNSIRVHRYNSSFAGDKQFAKDRIFKMPLSGKNNFDVKFLVDRTSIEVEFPDGQTYTMTKFPGGHSNESFVLDADDSIKYDYDYYQYDPVSIKAELSLQNGQTFVLPKNSKFWNGTDKLSYGDSNTRANYYVVLDPVMADYVLNYVDQDGKLIDQQKVTGRLTTSRDIKPNVPDGYELYAGQDVRLSINFNHQVSQRDLLVKHILSFVDSQDGKNKTDIIPGTLEKHYPTGVDYADLNKVITRTILVKDANGKVVKKVLQKASFVRNAIVDAVTGKIIYLGWSNDGKVTLPAYYPDVWTHQVIGSVDSVEVTPDRTDWTVTIQYQMVPTKVSINYVDHQGDKLKTVNKVGKSGELLVLDQLPLGYQLVTKKEIRVGDLDQDVYNVLVVPVRVVVTNHDDKPLVHEPLTKLVTRTVNIVMPNRKVRVVHQQVRFERRAIVKFDGSVEYTDWQAIGSDRFNKLNVPKRKGWKLEITGGNLDRVDHVKESDGNQVVTVKYVRV